MKKLFEVSWEVCNKVGGIYTVITSKYPSIKNHFDDYFFVGPYFPNAQNSEFSEEEAPVEFKEVFSRLRDMKIKCHYGRWKKNGAKTILIDFYEFMSEKNRIKTELWENFRVDSLFAGYDFDEPVVWSYSIGILLDELSKVEDSKIIGQFHEWMSGAGILYLKSRDSKVKTVFTTHATVLERAMASEKKSFMSGINADEESKKRNVVPKHTMEKQSALNCTVFTAVSENTAEACEKILGRKPEIIVVNGIDDDSAIFSLERKDNRSQKIKDFVIANFFPHYFFNLDKTKFFYISGRYEHISKGLDVFINSLSLLNDRLKEENYDGTIVVYFLIPSGITDVRSDLLRRYELVSEIRKKIYENSSYVLEKVFENFVKGEKDFKFFPEEELREFHATSAKENDPQIISHFLSYPNDFILRTLSENKLNNSKGDKVKVVFYPKYLTENDGLFNSSYYDLVSEFDLGIFPSFYEPWGYTPVECAALGVPAITSDLSGFGKFIIRGGDDGKGIFVLRREGLQESEVSKELESRLYYFAKLSREELLKHRIEAASVAKKVSWNILIKNYKDAYRIALEK